MSLSACDATSRLSDVYAVGYPDAQPWLVLPCPEGFVSHSPAGTIKFTSRDVHPGLSGGALLASHKRLIGIVRRDDGSSGYALAIRRMIEQLGAWRQITDLRPATAAGEDSDPGITARDLAAKQAAILEAQMQPRFRFVPTLSSAGSETFDALELWNDGPAFEDYQAWQASYLEVTYAPGPGKQFVTRYLPVYYFRDRQYQQGAKTGFLARFLAWQANRRPDGGINETKEYARLLAEVQRRFGIEMRITRRVFFEIWYRDQARTDHRLIFEIYPSIGTVPFGPLAPILVREELQLQMVLTQFYENLTADNLLQYLNGGGVLADLGEYRGDP